MVPQVVIDTRERRRERRTISEPLKVTPSLF